MKKWLYTVSDWQCIFDFEISDSRAIEEYKKATGRIDIEFIHRDVIDYCPTTMLPEVSNEVLFALEKDMLRPDWFTDMVTLLSLNQPIIHEYLSIVNQRQGELAMLIGVVVYKMIESQIEADAL